MYGASDLDDRAEDCRALFCHGDLVWAGIEDIRDWKSFVLVCVLANCSTLHHCALSLFTLPPVS